MELKEFVSETLTQICEGVKDAQSKCGTLGARVNPAIDGDNVIISNHPSFWKCSKVHFSITLQSIEGDKGRSGIGVLLANVSLGTAEEKSQSSSSATSVEFSVPVGLPMYI